MENEKLSFSNSLWGRYEQLNERLQIKKHYFKSIHKIFQNIDDSLKTTLKKIKDSKIEENPPSDEEKDFHEIIKTFKQYLIESFDYDSQTLLNISNNIKTLLDKIHEEKKIYNELKNNCSEYENNKNSMNKSKKNYNLKSETAENSVINFKKSKIENSGNNAPEIVEKLKTQELNAKKSCEDASKEYGKYKKSVKKANEYREIFNKKQKEILYNFQEIEVYKGKLNSNMIQIILQNHKNQTDINQAKIAKFESIKNDLNINRDIKNMLLEFQSKEKPDGEIYLINFNSNIDFDKCENDEEFNFNVDCINYIREINKEEYPKYNQKLEQTKNDMRNLLTKMFDNSEAISTTDKETLLNYISNTETHFLFLIILSKLRTNNRFCQSKNLINILGEILNKILDNAKKNNIYSHARNCVILSQTFFYNNEKNEKVFILEKIINNPWMKSSEFWINYVEIPIKEEIEKVILSNYPEISMEDIINESEKINEKLKRKIGEILFSQLLTCINNMKEFNINNKIIINIVDDIIYKYNYLNEGNSEIAFGLITEDKENIQKIRNENAKNHKPKIKIEESKNETQNKTITKSKKTKFPHITGFFSKKTIDENIKERNHSMAEPVIEIKENFKDEKKTEKKELKEIKEDIKEDIKTKEPKIIEKNNDEIKKRSATFKDTIDIKLANHNKILQEMKNNINNKIENKFPNNNNIITKNSINTNSNIDKNNVTANKTTSNVVNFKSDLPGKNITNNNNNNNIANINLRKTFTASQTSQIKNEPNKDDKYSIFNVKLKKLPSKK